MNEYERLRERAKLKRDKAIEKARNEYRASVSKINELERKLGGASRKGSADTLKPLIDVIRDSLPRDRLFTIAEVVQRVQEADQDRVFNYETIRAFFTQLSLKDEVRRVRRGERHTVLWAVTEHPAAASPFGPDNVTEVCQKILAERGPLRPVEITVAIKATGYRPHADHKTMMKCVHSALGSNPEKFQRGGDGRWQVLNINAVAS